MSFLRKNQRKPSRSLAKAKAERVNKQVRAEGGAYTTEDLSRGRRDRHTNFSIQQVRVQVCNYTEFAERREAVKVLM